MESTSRTLAKDDTYTMTAPGEDLRPDADQLPHHGGGDPDLPPHGNTTIASATTRQGRRRGRRRCVPPRAPSRWSTLRTRESHEVVQRTDGGEGRHHQIASGEVIGLLGANGAGKTTTFSMVVGLTAPIRGACCSTASTSPTTRWYIRARKGSATLPQEARSSAASPSNRTSWRSSRRWKSRLQRAPGAPP